MGQSVKEAFGIDLSSLSVEKLREDPHLCEHVHMACLVETTARGKEFRCGGDAESVYACAEELFGGVHVQDFLHDVLLDGRCTASVARERKLSWLCGFLEYVSRRLGVDVLPRGVSMEWFIEKALLWVSVTDGCGRVHDAISDDDYEWAFLRLLYYSKCFFSYRCDRTMTKLSAVGWSKLCLGASRFRDFEIRASWGVLNHKEFPTEDVSLDTLITEVYQFKYSILKVERYGRADAVLSLLLQMFLGVRFLALDYDLFDFEMLDKFTALVKSPMYLNTGFSGEPTRLYVYCANTFLMRYDDYDHDCMGYVEPHIFVEGDFTDVCDTLRESDIYLLRGVSFSYLDWESPYYRNRISDPYFGIDGLVDVWFKSKEPLREWSVLPYDSQTLKREVATQLKVEGTPLGIIDVDATEMCGFIETPLLGQRRITMDLFKFYYPDGVNATCYRNFRGIPFVLWLEGLGVYYVVDDYLMLLPFDHLHDKEKGFWGCKCPLDMDAVREMDKFDSADAYIDDGESDRLRHYGLNFDYYTIGMKFNHHLNVGVAWTVGLQVVCNHRFRGDLSEVESWEDDFVK